LSIARTVNQWALAAFLLLAAGGAHAELWGYVDDKGVARFATEKLDDRYVLFFRGRTSMDAPAEDPAEREAVERFKQSRLYRRIVNHPNVVRFQSLIEQNARLQGVDPALVKAIVAVESSFEPAASSVKRALGLMQVTLDTAARYGVVGDATRSAEQKILEPATNIRVGTRYLHDLLSLFDNNLALTLAAYNAGEQAVARYRNQVPPFPETQEYVKLVQQFYALYRPAASPAPPARVTIPKRRIPPDNPRLDAPVKPQ
jgi:soluble lytic murein transglycosylase-like protein